MFTPLTFAPAKVHGLQQVSQTWISNLVIEGTSSILS